MAEQTSGGTLANTVASIATVPSGQTWRVASLTVNNTGDTAQELHVQLVDASASATLTVVPGYEVLPKLIFEPLPVDLVLNSGDQLQARGPTSGSVTLSYVITIDDEQ